MPRMLHRFPIWLTALLLAMPPAAVAEPSITFATFNCEFLCRRKVHVKFGLPFDQRDWSEQQQQQWEPDGFRDERFHEAVVATAPMIATLNADVIALQEVGNEPDLAELMTELQRIGAGYPHAALCKSTDYTTGQHVALLSRFPLTDVRVQIPGRAFYDAELDDPQTELETGISKGLRATLTIDALAIDVFVVHLASERGGHEQDAQRIAQATIVRRNVLPQLVRRRHVVVMGDLNAYRGQPTLRRLRGRDDIFEDMLQTAGPTFHPRKASESNDAYNRRVGDHWTYEWAGRRSQIDHILVSRSLYELSGRSGITVRFVTPTDRLPSTGTLISDHRAMVLKWKAAGGVDKTADDPSNGR